MCLVGACFYRGLRRRLGRIDEIRGFLVVLLRMAYGLRILLAI